MKYLRISVLAVIVLMIAAACSTSASTSTPTAQPVGVSGTAPAPSGLITSVTMAKGTSGDTKDPVNPTMVFGTTDVIHAVAKTNNAPDGTQFKAIWYAVVNSNQVLTTTPVTTGGTVNIDFQLSPTTTWPAGAYQVEIYVNGTLDQVVNFSVQ